MKNGNGKWAIEDEKMKNEKIKAMQGLTSKEKYIEAKMILATLRECDNNELQAILRLRGIGFHSDKKNNLAKLLVTSLQEEIDTYEKEMPNVNEVPNILANNLAKRRTSENENTTETKKPKVDPTEKNEASKKLEDQLFFYLADKYGTKIAYLLNILRVTWQKDPSIRFLICAKDSEPLERVEEILTKQGIDCINTLAWQIPSLNFKIRQAHLQSSTRVALLLFGAKVPELKAFGATHVIFLQPVYNSRTPLTIEKLAVMHAIVKGRQSTKTVIRLVAQNSLEHAYLMALTPESFAVGGPSVFTKEILSNLLARQIVFIQFVGCKVDVWTHKERSTKEKNEKGSGSKQRGEEWSESEEEDERGFGSDGEYRSESDGESGSEGDGSEGDGSEGDGSEEDGSRSEGD